MDFSESTKVVYDRIQKIDPENVSKIIGYLLLQDNGEREMIRLAFSPDNLIRSLIVKAKSELRACKPLAVPVPLSHPVNSVDIPTQFSSYSPPSASRVVSTPSSLGLHNRMRNLSLEDQCDFVVPANSDFSTYYPAEHQFCSWPRSRRSPSLPEFPVKICHYFSKGFCKHGTTCRYFHANPQPEILPQNCPNGYDCEDPVFSQGSLERLELELTELLKSRGGIPVSIASLPMLYYDMYGKSLQAEGYLTESQRHGKAGLSLSKLLSRLKNSIRLLDRPHGQHSVILAEDAQKYSDSGNERFDPPVITSSRQIYLTFPADSTFTEQDVSNYFNKFGPVQDVRIPCQQKRMFGFVTFIFSETAKQALLKGNPHFICGSRVLVKPYKEKARLVDRKYFEKMQNVTCYNQHLLEGDADPQSSPGCSYYTMLLRKGFLEDPDHALEQEQRLLVLSEKSSVHYPYFGFPAEQLNISQAHHEFIDTTSTECPDYFSDIMHASSNSSDTAFRPSTNCSELDSGNNLPDSPFASSSISTVM
ncbi:hypothetical protein MLD38_025771 [Melastoma candidum]|uniref:Uncharacterized protein n=1 Tax=Melastoma candidum TaxID=119954 RepID=A0ACB9NWV3_9MYRT|nr:hypothetical protein MLD38_025771 [Melastoma candidum]